MRLLSCRGAGRVELVEAPEPVPGPAEVLVRVEASALCGSERTTLMAGSGGLPFSNAGHEAAGVVTWAPAGSGVQPGERVGISGLRGCAACEPCLGGREMFCVMGVRTQLDLHADVVAVAASTVRTLPPGTTAQDAVLLSGDALGVPVRAAARAPSRPGDRVVVMGLGPVGLSHALVRAHAGAQVVAFEPSEYRRRLAAAWGVEVLAPGASTPAAALVIEATGVPEVIREAFTHCTPGGTVLQSGECAAVELHPSAQVIHREISYVGSWFYGAEDYPAMLDLVAQGLAVGRLVTHVLPAAQAQEAVDAFLSAESGKVVLSWS